MNKCYVCLAKATYKYFGTWRCRAHMPKDYQEPTFTRPPINKEYEEEMKRFIEERNNRDLLDAQRYLRYSFQPVMRPRKGIRLELKEPFTSMTEEEKRAIDKLLEDV